MGGAGVSLDIWATEGFKGLLSWRFLEIYVDVLDLEDIEDGSNPGYPCILLFYLLSHHPDEPWVSYDRRCRMY